MSNERRRTYSGERRRRPSSNKERSQNERVRRAGPGSRPNLSEREYYYYRRRAQIRRRRLFLLVLVFVLFLTGRSFLQLNTAANTKEEVAVTSVDTGNGTDTTEEKDNNEENTTDDKPVFGTYVKKNWIHNLNIAAKTNPNAKLIVDNLDNLPDPLIKLSGNNFDAIDFVAKSIDPNIEIKFEYPGDVNGGKYPYYIQWDERWGYEKYAGGIIGHTGCAPTVVAMAISGQTGTNATPTEMAKLSADNGFSNDEGTGWNYYPFIAEEYNMQLEEIPNNDKSIKQHLEEGHAVIISVKPGQFTQGGHVMLIVGVDDEGKYILNDPNSLQNTRKHWDYNEFKGDLKKIWAFYK